MGLRLTVLVHWTTTNPYSSDRISVAGVWMAPSIQKGTQHPWRAPGRRGRWHSRELRRFPSSLDRLLELTVFMQSRTSLAYLFSRFSYAFGFGLCTSYATACRIRGGGRASIYADAAGCWGLNVVHA